MVAKADLQPLSSVGIRSEHGPNRWKLAAECGLSTVDTLITNDPDALRLFCGHAEHGVVVKSLGAASIVEDDQVKVAYTRRLVDEDLRTIQPFA